MSRSVARRDSDGTPGLYQIRVQPPPAITVQHHGTSCSPSSLSTSGRTSSIGPHVMDDTSSPGVQAERCLACRGPRNKSSVGSARRTVGAGGHHRR